MSLLLLFSIDSCSVFVPVDVIKERLQVQSSSSSSKSYQQQVVYKSSFDALKTIGRTEGLRGVYKGYFATLACFGPFSAIYFMLYDSVSEILTIKHIYYYYLSISFYNLKLMITVMTGKGFCFINMGRRNES
jgi:hypothetical protein